MKQAFTIAMTTAAAAAWSHYEFSLVDFEQFSIGLLKGTIETAVPDLMTCINDAETLVQDVEVAYGDFKKETFDGVKDGIEEIGTIVKAVATDINDCKTGIAAIETLVHIAEGVSSPWSFAYHVGKDLLLNGVDIYNDIDNAIKEYEASNYEGFGENVGKALASVFVGEATTGYTLSSAEIETILVAIVEGAIDQSVPSIDTCIKDITATANDIETAVADFRKETLSSVEDGIKALGDAVTSVV